MTDKNRGNQQTAQELREASELLHIIAEQAENGAVELVEGEIHAAIHKEIIHTDVSTATPSGKYIVSIVSNLLVTLINEDEKYNES